MMDTMVKPVFNSISKAGSNFMWWLELPDEQDPVVQWLEGVGEALSPSGPIDSERNLDSNKLLAELEDTLLQRLLYLDQVAI